MLETVSTFEFLLSLTAWFVLNKRVVKLVLQLFINDRLSLLNLNQNLFFFLLNTI
jgi:hypothetical protein